MPEKKKKITINNYFKTIKDTNPVKICIGVLRHVIIEDNINTLNIHATTK